MLLNAAKCQSYSFYRFWVIKEKSTEGEGVKLPNPTQIRVKQLTSMQDLENNDQVILDPLGNIYEK